MRFACALGILLASTASARAADWKSVFAGEAVTAPLAGPPRNFLVVGLSTAPAEGARAAAALAQTLVQKRYARAVFEQRALGILTGLDDAGLVARANALPVDVVAIIRIAPSGEGALVAYDRKAVRLLALAIFASGEVRDDEDAVATISAATDDALRLSPSSAQALYDQQFLGFDGWASVPFEGASRHALTEAALFEKLGRPELAARNRSRRTLRIGLIVTGAIIMLGGLAGIITQAVLYDRSYTQVTVGYIAGTLIGGAGGGLFISGLATSPHAISEEEVRGMTGRYNDRLRKQLGLTLAARF